MRTETISWLKENLSNLDLSERIVIIQNGKPFFVIESVESRAQIDESIAILKFALMGKDDVINGKSSRVTINK